MGNVQQKREERIIEKCMDKGYMVCRIQNKLYIQKGNFETNITFDGKDYNDITKTMMRYLKTILKK